jgi:hypothetical protein
MYRCDSKSAEREIETSGCKCLFISTSRRYVKRLDNVDHVIMVMNSGWKTFDYD